MFPNCVQLCPPQQTKTTGPKFGQGEFLGDLLAWGWGGEAPKHLAGLPCGFLSPHT